MTLSSPFGPQAEGSPEPGGQGANSEPLRDNRVWGKEENGGTLKEGWNSSVWVGANSECFLQTNSWISPAAEPWFILKNSNEGYLLLSIDSVLR